MGSTNCFLEKNTSLDFLLVLKKNLFILISQFVFMASVVIGAL